jgi:hypothetical protein
MLVQVQLTLLLATLVFAGDLSCTLPLQRTSRSSTVLGYKQNVLDLYTSRVEAAQNIITQDAFTPLGNMMSPVPFVGTGGLSCVRCQVDCMSQVKIWPSASTNYVDTLFVEGTCKYRYFGYGCRTLLGCNLMSNDIFFYSAIMACAQYSGCESKYPTVLSYNTFNPGFIASIDYSGTVGQNSPAVTVTQGINSYWVQIAITPSINVQSVSVKPVNATDSFALNNAGYNNYFNANPPSPITIGSKIYVTATMTSGDVVTTILTYWPTPIVTIKSGSNEYYVMITATPSTYISSMYIVPDSWNNEGITVPRASWGGDDFALTLSRSIPCGTNVDVQLIMTNGDKAGNFIVWDVC